MECYRSLTDSLEETKEDHTDSIQKECTMWRTRSQYQVHVLQKDTQNSYLQTNNMKY